jgi:Ca-activated chloride channel family protein
LWATRAIGNLLTQIRLHGEDSELVQSVVNLSIRYGIITPYTSYLIEEDDIFTQTGRNIILEESMDAFAAPAEASGAMAVEEAAAEAVMKEAEGFMPLPTAGYVAADGSFRSTDEIIQLVGSKTFVLRDGVWMDTTFDPDSQTQQEVGFASDAYFDLLSAAPDLGQYLALGQRVLVVYQGAAYEVVNGPGQQTIDLPEAKPAGDPSTDDTKTKDKDKDSPQESPQDASGLNICGSALLAPMLLIGAVFVAGRRKAKRLS